MTSAHADPARMSAREVAASIREGRLSARELTEACLARVAEREETVRAWHCLRPDLARAEAERIDAQRPGGVLTGVPIGVKDIVATAELPTACGSPIYRDRQAHADAACIAALKAEGGLVLGKTTTTEFAAYTPAKTRNPRNPSHTPGGSSSGSAAAVADFHVPLAIGTQTAGSVIRPASFCGIVGYKPTFGTVGVAGVQPFAASLDTVGVFARDVADAALLVSAMAGWPELARTEPHPPARVRVARGPRWGAASPEAAAALDRAAAFFAEAGMPVEDDPLPDGFEGLVDVQDRIQVFEGSRALRWERETRGDLLSEGLKAQFARAEATDFEAYREARMAQLVWQRRVDELMTDGEVWVTASAPGEAPEGLGSTGDPIFCRAWTLLHLPCISLPNGAGKRGLPLGTQLVGRRFADRALISAAAWLEARLD